ncbi:MAG: hypothetical protein BM556_05080 [Bacteriovorax sp. MedPE-SWde]|nr:MAG: hypothetical protein BM556_05080 [Bacteriovorax sp. MedPE-SWde]
MSKIIIAIFATTSIYASTVNFEVFHSDKKNVYSMGYRLANRIFYKEKRIAERQCAKKLSEYALTSLTLDKNYKFHVTLNDIGIKVGQGKRSSVEFTCEMKVTGDFTKTLLDDQTLSNRLEATKYCYNKAEELQESSEELVIHETLKNECKVYSL